MKLRLLGYAFVVAFMMMMLVRASHANDSSIGITSGYYYTSGKYGGAIPTKTGAIPFNFSYEDSDWDISVGVPYLFQTGPSNALRGIGQLKNNKGQPLKAALSTAASQSNAGIGDVVASGGYKIYSNDEYDFDVGVRLKSKFGSASAKKFLGDGANDYSAELDFSKSYGPANFFANAIYTKLGNPSSFKILKKNFAGYAIGGYFNFTDQFNVGLLYENGGTEDQFDEPANVNQVTEYASYNFSEDWYGEVYYLKGYSFRSPDYSFGFSLKYSF